MEQFFAIIDKIFSINVFGNMTLYQLLSTILKYVFVIIVLYFIYAIIRVIYYDVRYSISKENISNTYLKLIRHNQGIKFKTQEYYYIENNNTIGRDNKNSICIKDKFLSSFHARIILEEGIYFLEDLHSSNGTFLNNERITEAIELKSGDIIKLGQLEFLFVNGDEDE